MTFNRLKSKKYCAFITINALQWLKFRTNRFIHGNHVNGLSNNKIPFDTSFCVHSFAQSSLYLHTNGFYIYVIVWHFRFPYGRSYYGSANIHILHSFVRWRRTRMMRFINQQLSFSFHDHVSEFHWILRLKFGLHWTRDVEHGFGFTGSEKHTEFNQCICSRLICYSQIYSVAKFFNVSKHYEEMCSVF